MAPWIMRAGHRGLVLRGCRNRSEDQRKLANVSFVMCCVPMLVLISSIAVVVMVWLEWQWHFEWAQ